MKIFEEKALIDKDGKIVENSPLAKLVELADPRAKRRQAVRQGRHLAKTDLPRKMKLEGPFTSTKTATASGADLPRTRIRKIHRLGQGLGGSSGKAFRRKKIRSRNNVAASLPQSTFSPPVRRRVFPLIGEHKLLVALGVRSRERVPGGVACPKTKVTARIVAQVLVPDQQSSNEAVYRLRCPPPAFWK
jgi:hypothetical protein